jgi:hypothetical protein
MFSRQCQLPETYVLAGADSWWGWIGGLWQPGSCTPPAWCSCTHTGWGEHIVGAGGWRGGRRRLDVRCKQVLNPSSATCHLHTARQGLKHTEHSPQGFESCRRGDQHTGAPWNAVNETCSECGWHWPAPGGQEVTPREQPASLCLSQLTLWFHTPIQCRMHWHQPNRCHETGSEGATCRFRVISGSLPLNAHCHL